MLIARINALALSALLAIAPVAAEASQAVLYSPTTGTVSGLQLTNNYNNALDALNSCNAGATAPVNQLSGVPSLGNCWANTTGNVVPVNYYDGLNWLPPLWLDTVNHVVDVKIGGGTASVASSATVDLCGTAVMPIAYLSVTGNTTITSFGASCPAGQVKIVTFAAALTLTYNATSLLIPGAASVSTAAGDQAVLVSLGSGNWQVVAYTPANGQALINPSVDVGTYQLTSGFTVPSAKYLLAYGQAISRTTYAGYLAVATLTQSVTRTNGSPTLTGFTDTTQIRAGAPVEGAGIPTGATVSSCTSTTCTMASTCSGGACNASSSGTANVTIFPYGNGDGATTFNMPNCADVVLAGRGNMSGSSRNVLTSSFFGVSPDALGAFGGGQFAQLSPSNIPTISSSGSNNIGVSGSTTSQVLNGYAPAGVAAGGNSINTVTGVGNVGVSASGTNTISVASTNTGGATPTAFSTVQPTLTANCMVRVLAMRMPADRRLAANDAACDSAALLPRRRLAA